MAHARGAASTIACHQQVEDGWKLVNSNKRKEDLAR
jgi:hypothetical protein